jgi:hypothetical protein
VRNLGFAASASRVGTEPDGRSRRPQDLRQAVPDLTRSGTLRPAGSRRNGGFCGRSRVPDRLREGREKAANRAYFSDSVQPNRGPCGWLRPPRAICATPRQKRDSTPVGTPASSLPAWALGLR